MICQSAVQGCNGLKATSALLHLFHGLTDLSTPAASTLICGAADLLSTLQVNKKAKAKRRKVEQPPGNTETSLQPAPAPAELLEIGSSIHPAPHKADKEKSKKGKKLGTASAPIAGKSGTPNVHSKAVKPPKEVSTAEAHAGTEADASEQGQTHEAAVGNKETDASALGFGKPEPATGEQPIKHLEQHHFQGWACHVAG